MTLAVLTRTLEEELEALLAGELGECLVCGEPVEVERGRVECQACGSVLEPVRRPSPGQLSLL
jgi:hypothetical protein